jgi:hypothetical protein
MVFNPRIGRWLWVVLTVPAFPCLIRTGRRKAAEVGDGGLELLTIASELGGSCETDDADHDAHPQTQLLWLIAAWFRMSARRREVVVGLVRFLLAGSASGRKSTKAERPEP